MTGKVLSERYEIQQQLGKNAGRRTLLARDWETQELVVIKLVSFGSDFEWDDLKLFEREAETLKALTHPAIPRYLDFFELDSPESKGFALVQTYVEGKSLEQHLKAGRTFSEGEVRQIAKALLEILIYLHGRNPPVIHRDIKPSNILLTNRSGNSVGEVYLVDFGSVQTIATREGITYTVVGTYGYMPLEQFGGRTVAASDLYSLGATLIYLVTGTHPADLPQKDGQIEFEQAANLTPTFTNWLRWMTQPSLDQRLTSAQKALQALEQERQRDIDPPVVRQIAGSKVSLEQERQRDIDPLVVRQIAGSKVLLTKNADSLEILIPPEGFSCEIVALILFAIPWNSFVFFWTAGIFSTSCPGNIIFVLFLLPFWGSGICMLWGILFDLFGRVRLRLNHQQISLTYELFGLKFGSRLTPRQDIHKLAVVYSTEGNPQTIAIWAGRQEYQLDRLTALELDWLTHELSDWLRLPIQVRKIPPVQA